MNTFDEEKIPALICGFLDPIAAEGDVVRGFLPEAWRDGYAAVWMIGGRDVIRDYVDGSQIIGITFDIRVRCAGEDVGDRIDVLGFYRRIADFVRENTVESDGSEGKIIVKAGASKSAIFESGEEEYRASYVFRFMKKTN